MSTFDDDLTEFLRRLPTRGTDRVSRADCPDEETLAIFLSGSLEGGAKRQIEAHLAECSFCVEELVAASKSGELGIDEVPQRLMGRAMDLVKGREPTFDLVVRLVKGSIELISTSARMMPAPSPALRGPIEGAGGNALQVEHEVGRFRVAVELDLREAGSCQVVANVREETGEPAEGVRLSLSSGDREQASFLTRGGVVVFDRVAPGEYSIAISESGASVGRIRLNLML